MVWRLYSYLNHGWPLLARRQDRHTGQKAKSVKKSKEGAYKSDSKENKPLLGEHQMV
jgi:hypothetical protein